LPNNPRPSYQFRPLETGSMDVFPKPGQDGITSPLS
jgi:hypothetical protein